MRNTFAAAFAILALTACVEVDDPVPDPGPAPPDENAPGEVTPLFGDDRPDTFGVIEMGKAWPRDFLSVCWTDAVLNSTSVEVTTLRPKAEQIVMREWGRLGRVRFTPPPWRSCTDWPTSDIRIGIHTATEEGEGRSELGIDAEAIEPGLPTMTLSFGPFGRGCATNGAGLLCDDDGDGNEDPVPFLDVQFFQWLVLHEFGHALGLRHEQAHEGSTCVYTEAIDTAHLDGQSIFTYDPGSVMNRCANEPNQLTSGDIRALHILYPGVVGLFANSGFGGVQTPIGPGFYTAATLPALPSTSSMVVPPGYQVTICAGPTCLFAATTRALDPMFNNKITSILVAPAVLGADLYGYQGVNAFITDSGSPPWGGLTNDRMSSLFVAPTRVAMVCTERDPAGGPLGSCASFIGGGPLDPDSIILPRGIDDDVSHITIGTRVITYSERFTGTSSALGIGVYRASNPANTFLPALGALAIHGLEVRACTQEGIATPVSPGGAGDCRVYKQSADLATQVPAHGPIRFLQVRMPTVVAP